MQDHETHDARCCGDFRAKFDQWKQCAEKSVHDEPVKTAGLAFAAGIALTVLPVGRIVGGLVRMAFALVQPVLLILGVVKLVEEFDKEKNRE